MLLSLLVVSFKGTSSRRWNKRMMVGLCREFDISRNGYKILTRYNETGLDGLSALFER